jgi:predicted TIM-barrel fold metal-dependent hydrolase
MSAIRPAGSHQKAVCRYGSLWHKLQQFDQLEWFLDYVAPRRVIGAHLGGFSEDPEFLESMLSRHENYYLDTSATKWIVREVSPRAHAFHDLMTKYADRIIFGSDLVTGDGYDFDHYASRYWTHLHLWESDYRGESPIEDPDAEPPLLNGVDLPADVLEKVYRRNAEQLGIFSTTE